jgi:hypothetical protein
MAITQQRGAQVPIIIDTETAFKTTPVSPDAHLLYYKDESLRLNRNLLESATLRGNRNPLQPVRGNVDVAGDINFELSHQYGKLFKHIFGGYDVDGGGPYVHTYTVGNLPVGMVIEKQFKDFDTDKFFLYNGCKVASYKMSMKSEGFIECSVSIMGARETVGNASFDDLAVDNGHTPFDGFSGSVLINGVASGVITTADLTVDNGLDGNTYVIDGSGERYSMPEGKVKVSGNITALFTSVDLYMDAVNYVEKALEFRFSRGTGDGSDGNEKMQFFIDEVIFKPQGPVVQGPTGMIVEIPFEAFYNNDSDASTIRVINTCSIATF